MWIYLKKYEKTEVMAKNEKKAREEGKVAFF